MGHGPLFSNVSQGQIEQFRRCVVVREVAPAFDDFPQRHIQTLNGVGGVDDLSDRLWVSKEGGHMLPISSP